MGQNSQAAVIEVVRGRSGLREDEEDTEKEEERKTRLIL